jgi:hypothetical protein
VACRESTFRHSLDFFNLRIEAFGPFCFHPTGFNENACSHLFQILIV